MDNVKTKSVIRVTQEDIDNGVRTNCFNCPLSLAVKRSLNAVSADVSRWCIEFKLASGLAGRFVLPKEAVDFVRGFDSDKKVEPFEFEIEY